MTDKDFVSFDESELTLPRQPDGRLPTIQCMRPAVGSPLPAAGRK